jgi:hypothetical protein
MIGAGLVLTVAGPLSLAGPLVDQFRRTSPPTSAQITTAAEVAESFLTHAFAGRAAEALALMPPPDKDADLTVIPDAIWEFAKRHGALKSTLLLRGRSLAVYPEYLQGEENSANVDLAQLWLFYLCTTEKGPHRACLHLRQAKTDTTKVWKVVAAGSVPLEKDGWTVWEMSINAGFAVGRRAGGDAAQEWEPLFAAAREQAKLLGVSMPPLPSWSGKPATDLAAAEAWLMKTLPDALQAVLPADGQSAAREALLAAAIQVRHAAGHGEAQALLDWLNGDDSPEVEPWIFTAVLSDLSATGFGHLLLCHASRYAAFGIGFADDPLFVAIEYTKGTGSPLVGNVTTKTFGASLDTLVAAALNQVRKAPAWEVDVELTSSVLDGRVQMIWSGDSASITCRDAEGETTRVIIIGADTWSRAGEKGNWRKNSGSFQDRIFQTLTKKIFDAEAGGRHWFVNGQTATIGDPSWGKVAPDGRGVISNQGDNRIFGEYWMACKPRGPGTYLEPGYALTTTAAGTWRLCGFDLHFEMDQGRPHAMARSLGMTPLDKKPEIKEPSIPGR